MVLLLLLLDFRFVPWTIIRPDRTPSPAPNRSNVADHPRVVVVIVVLRLILYNIISAAPT